MPGVKQRLSTSSQPNWHSEPPRRSSSTGYRDPADMREMSPYRNEHRISVNSNGYISDQQSVLSTDDTPTYVMEHLATFTVSKDTGIVYPADGMRRLLQLEKSNGIWSQKMQMRLDRSWILIMDYETEQVMERFPVHLIQEPTAFTSTDPMEMYNNILVFIVGDDSPRSAQGRSEMHIFQCQNISAQELVEDLKLVMGGKLPPPRPGYRASPRHIPPPPATPPPQPPHNGVNVREQVSVFNAATSGPAQHSETRSQPRSEPGGAASINDETSSTSSEKYERDVAILNHCFDDIEKFIARLQHAAAAARELDRRRRSRKSKKKDYGDGMLTMRAKPPPEREFVDIFQKFKLSFNLLAKLKSHIHDPNAPELVHFLFTPLALIVDASHDTHYGPNLPSKVVSPLLTREAVNLLINCVTSKETELWHSLGDAWLIPRDQWKSYVPPYHPIFMDGWSPEYPISDERDRVGALGTAVASEAKRTRGDEIRAAQQEVVVNLQAEMREQQYHRDDSHYSSDYFEYERQERSPVAGDARRFAYDNHNYQSRQDLRRERYSRDERERSHTPPSERDFNARDPSARSDISADSIERNGGDPQTRFERSQRHWLEDLRARGAKIVQVTYPRTANNDKELTVTRGEYLEVLDDTRKWWKARNSRGQTAHVPHTIVTPYPGTDQDVFSNPLYTRGYTQDSSREREAPRSPPIPPPAPAEWVRKERLGKKATKSALKKPSPSSSEEEIKENGIVEEIPPPPPPLPSPPASPDTRRGTMKSTTSALSRAHSQQDLVHEELKHVLTLFRQKRRQDLDIHKTPEVYIHQHSTAGEVQQWLEAKGFSDKVCKQLKNMSGEDLFKLKRKDLQMYCGKDEGRRLDSQITIQRNISGYKTASTSELRKVLEKARQKAEVQAQGDGNGDSTLSLEADFQDSDDD